MIFSKKVTLYVNSRAPVADVANRIADAASMLHSNSWLDDWQIEFGDGLYERFCNCGAADCADAGVLQ